MNIFLLHPNHEQNVPMYVDSHVRKMPLETAQILSTVCHINGCKDIPYEPTHQNHPCVLWAAESLVNFHWLADLGLQICYEYLYRFESEHKSMKVIQVCKRKLPYTLVAKPGTPHVICTDGIRMGNHPWESYQLYYLLKKRHLFKWTERPIPQFIKPKGLDYSRSRIFLGNYDGADLWYCEKSDEIAANELIMACNQEPQNRYLAEAKRRTEYIR